MNDKSINSCQSLRLTLLQFDDLPPDEKIHVERHLECCEDCRRQFNDIRQTVNDLPPLQTDVTAIEARRFAARVSRRLEEPRKKSARPFVLGGTLTAAAALLLFVLIQPGSPPLPPPAQNTSDTTLAQTSELEFLENMEMLEDLELLMLLAQGQG